MNNKRLIIYGIGKLAEYTSYVFENDSNYKVKGFCIEKDFFLKNSKFGFKTSIFEEIEQLLLKENYYLFIAVGNNSIRKRIYLRAKELNIKMATYISSKASTWPDLETGDNCFIGEGSVIQPYVKIGANSIIFSSRIGHHSMLGDHTMLSATTLAGNVSIGALSFLGINSSIQQNLSIAPKNIIGMGVEIKASTLEGEIYSSPNSKKRNLSFDDISDTYLN